MSWVFCIAYGPNTHPPITISLGVSTTYDSGSFTTNVISSVLDVVLAGILVYTGLVEMLARDFLFNPTQTRDLKRLAFTLISLYLGMVALLGKWG